MKRILTFAFLCILSAGISVAEAQDLGRFMKKRENAAKDAAGERVGKEADKGIKKGVNRQLDKLFGTSEEEEKTTEPSANTSTNSSSESSSSSYNPGMKALMGAMGMSGDANVKDRYEFDGFVEMTITNYDESGSAEESGIYKTFIDYDSYDYGMQFTDDNQQGASTMIFDTENSVMVTLMDSDGEKSGFAIGFDPGTLEEYESTEVDESVEEDAYNPYNLKKTGKSKKITGYSCDEYLMDDENSTVHIWVTDDLQKKVNKSFMKNNNFAGLFFYAYYVDGFVMEYDYTDKSDDDRMVMTVTDIDLSRKTTLDTGSYNIMNMGAMEEQMQSEEVEE